MRFCSASNCSQPVFGTDKISKKGYCRSHQTLREDYDRRTILQRAMDKQKKIEGKVRSLPHISEEELSRNQLISDLDQVVSLYVRKRSADKNGFVVCITCGVRKQWNKMQCSHYIGRSNFSLRFNTTYNCNPACKHCNEVLHGNLPAYKDYLEKLYPGITEQLEEQSREVCKIGIDELKQMLIDYRAKLRIFESKLKTNNAI